MNRTEIKKERKRIDKKIEEYRKGILIAHAELRVIEMQCEHPKEFKTMHQGDSGTKCPDCGYAT